MQDLNDTFKDWDFYIDDEVFIFLKGQNDILKNTILVINHIDTLGHYHGTDSLVYENSCRSLFSLIKIVLNINMITFFSVIMACLGIQKV